MNRKLCAALFAALVLAASVYAQTEADFKLDVTQDGEGVIITGYTGKEAAVKIPAIIQGIPVREIGNRAFYQNRIITSVTLPEGLEAIGTYAFRECAALSAVTLPQSLKKIGISAFLETGISAVTIPGSLAEFDWNDSGYNSAFYGCKKLTTVTVQKGVKEIPAGMFYNCTALTTVTLPEGLEKIGSEAFIGCTALVTVTVPDSVETIEFSYSWDTGAFEGCSKLPLATQVALRKRGYKGKF